MAFGGCVVPSISALYDRETYLSHLRLHVTHIRKRQYADSPFFVAAIREACFEELKWQKYLRGHVHAFGLCT